MTPSAPGTGIPRRALRMGYRLILSGQSAPTPVDSAARGSGRSLEQEGARPSERTRTQGSAGT